MIGCKLLRDIHSRILYVIVNVQNLSGILSSRLNVDNVHDKKTSSLPKIPKHLNCPSMSMTEFAIIPIFPDIQVYPSIFSFVCYHH